MKKKLLTFLALLITGIISAQVGIGTTDPKSGLDINTSLGYKVTSITSATTLDDTYNVVLCNNAPYTVTLPPAAANTGRVYRIKNIDPSGDAITIDGNGSETIDGESTYLLQPYKHSITLISNGTNWYVLEYYNEGNYIEGAISTINCSGTNNGTLVNGVAASSVNSVLSYTGGNAGTHSGQTVTSTGVTGLTATLSAGTFANGAGSLTYTITGTPSGTGTATFALNIGGQTCNLNRTVGVVSQHHTYWDQHRLDLLAHGARLGIGLAFDPGGQLRTGRTGDRLHLCRVGSREPKRLLLLGIHLGSCDRWRDRRIDRERIDAHSFQARE